MKQQILFRRLCLFFAMTAAIMNSYGQNQVKHGVGTYEKKVSKSKIEIPFELNGMNIMVKAKMNDVNINLLIDNGVMWDQLWFFGNDQVDSLGFTYEKEEVKITGAGEGNSIDSRVAVCPEIHFDQVTFMNQPALVSPKEQGFYKMFPGVAGQLCGMFFMNFITEFDFERNIIVLHEPNDFNPHQFSHQVRMRRDTMGSYLVPITINNKGVTIEKDIYIDLGGVYPLSLVLDNDFKLSGNEEKKLLGYGASGPIYGYESHVDYIIFGSYTMSDIDIILTEDPNGGGHTNLTIGLPIFMNFNIAFDYFNNIIYLDPKSKTNLNE